MARRPAHTPLSVFLNGRLVGVLKKETSGAVSFRYDDAWLGWPTTFPISLSLPLREDAYIGADVLNVFDNLLPDGVDLRRRIAERVGAAGADAYSLLASLGRDCVGALQFLPDGLDPGTPGSVDGELLSDSDVAEILANLASAPLGMGRAGGFRISLAGAQEKTALLRIRGEWYRPLGATATTHILKPRIGMLPNGIDLSHSVENEHFCLKLMAAFGLPTAETEIVDFDDRRVLVVERFDRQWRRDDQLLFRLPQEDLCQALSVPSTLKYEAEGGPDVARIVDLLMASDDPDVDVALFLRSLLAFWLIGAPAGHAKNFSIAIGPGGRFRLTPLYDVLSTQLTFDAKRLTKREFRSAMSVGVDRRYQIERIAPRHFLQTAAQAGFGESVMRDLMHGLAADAAGQAEKVANDLPPGFPEDLTGSVLRAVRRRAAMLAA